MSAFSQFHVVVVGSDQFLLESMWDEIARRSGFRFSFIMHPREIGSDFASPPRTDRHFFRMRLRETFPEPDLELLASLEQDGVRTINNMILGDSVVSTLPGRDALRYTTFLARRLMTLFEELQPSVVIGSFDGLHGGITQAVAKRMQIPWFAMNFSVIPAGLMCFCDRMLPAYRAQAHHPDPVMLRSLAEATYRNFQEGRVSAPAYISPPGLSFSESLRRMPRRAVAALKVVRRSRDREFLRYTQHVTDVSLTAIFKDLRASSRARAAIESVPLLKEPPQAPYVLFGLHTQPESSIDVWAPFFSNQYWVVETLVRAMPPTHKLLVKIHKSDANKYSPEHLARFRTLPGVELVHPFVDVRRFVDGSRLIVSIQGTMGLEGALLGKPVIMLGDSPVVLFPSVARMTELDGLPALVREMLARATPTREQILAAFVEYLRPFMPARHNDWTQPHTEEGFAGFVAAFRNLRAYVETTLCT